MGTGTASAAEHPRTDLALEAHQFARGRRSAIPGVDLQEERRGEVSVSRVIVQDEAGASAMGKPPGTYVTIEARGLRQRSRDLEEQVARALAAEIRALLPQPDPKVFVVGLGNWKATPDALGPKVVSHLVVSRHLADFVPEDLRGGLGSLCALAPGVLGITGLETVEIIEGITRRIAPDAVIAVDALASRSIERILTTVQISDAGINPGSGVGNHRKAITRATLGVPVIAIGVPTVVHAVTIAMDTIHLLVDRLRTEHPFYSYLDRLEGSEKQRVIREVLSPFVGDLMVTPKEIDQMIDNLARVVAGGINAAVHPRVAAQESIL